MNLILAFMTIPLFCSVGLKQDLDQRAKEAYIVYLYAEEADCDNNRYLGYLAGKIEAYKEAKRLVEEEEKRLEAWKAYVESGGE